MVERPLEDLAVVYLQWCQYLHVGHAGQ